MIKRGLKPPDQERSDALSLNNKTNVNALVVFVLVDVLQTLLCSGDLSVKLTEHFTERWSLQQKPVQKAHFDQKKHMICLLFLTFFLLILSLNFFVL